MRILLTLLILTAGIGSSAAAPPFQQVRGVIHLDSTVSGGEYDPEELVVFLRENDLEIAIFTDQATTSVEYGIFPARWIMGWFTGWMAAKALGRTGSLQTYGARRYLNEIDEIDAKYPDIIVIPGVESFPFFYWEHGTRQKRKRPALSGEMS